jgi:hypothetical protein
MRDKTLKRLADARYRALHSSKLRAYATYHNHLPEIKAKRHEHYLANRERIIRNNTEYNHIHQQEIKAKRLQSKLMVIV